MVLVTGGVVGFNVGTGASDGQGQARDIRVSKLQGVSIHDIGTVRNSSMREGKMKERKRMARI